VFRLLGLQVASCRRVSAMRRIGVLALAVVRGPAQGSVAAALLRKRACWRVGGARRPAPGDPRRLIKPLAIKAVHRGDARRSMIHRHQLITVLCHGAFMRHLIRSSCHTLLRIAACSRWVGRACMPPAPLKLVRSMVVLLLTVRLT
jgi:hypothetical protein